MRLFAVMICVLHRDKQYTASTDSSRHSSRPWRDVVCDESQDDEHQTDSIRHATNRTPCIYTRPGASLRGAHRLEWFCHAQGSAYRPQGHTRLRQDRDVLLSL